MFLNVYIYIIIHPFSPVFGQLYHTCQRRSPRFPSALWHQRWRRPKRIWKRRAPAIPMWHGGLVVGRFFS